LEEIKPFITAEDSTLEAP